MRIFRVQCVRNPGLTFLNSEKRLLGRTWMKWQLLRKILQYSLLFDIQRNFVVIKVIVINTVAKSNFEPLSQGIRHISRSTVASIPISIAALKATHKQNTATTWNSEWKESKRAKGWQNLTRCRLHVAFSSFTTTSPDDRA